MSDITTLIDRLEDELDSQFPPATEAEVEELAPAFEELLESRCPPAIASCCCAAMALMSTA